MTWRIGDNGFEMTLSARVPDIILEHLKPWLIHWLGKQSVSMDQVRCWAVHPGGPRIISAVEEALGLSADDTATSQAVLAAHGNLSPPKILFILNRLRKVQAKGPCVTLGFGPGLVDGVALLRSAD